MFMFMYYECYKVEFCKLVQGSNFRYSYGIRELCILIKGLKTVK